MSLKQHEFVLVQEASNLDTGIIFVLIDYCSCFVMNKFQNRIFWSK